MVMLALSKGDDMLWVFDMDNTLYGPTQEIERIVTARMKAVLCARAVIPEDAYEKRRGELKRIHATDDTILAFAMEYGLPYEDLIRETYLFQPLSCYEMGLRPGAKTIQDLPGKKSVLTNSPILYAQAILTCFGITSWFETIYANQPATPIKKPLPAAYRHIVSQEPVVMIEDSEANLLVPKQLGWTTIWFPVRQQEPPFPPHVDHVIDDLSLLRGLLR
jgi:putative hydrolase of the HAD superfamily